MKKNQIRLNTALVALVDEYINSNEPVSSRVLNEKYLTEVSSATLRLDLMKLEQADLIRQPHTSAGRVPTIMGYRNYLRLIEAEHENVRFQNMELLRELLIKHYKDTPLALHYIMLMLAQETDQLSFVAEPEVSGGYLAKLEVFPIGNSKYIFVMSLDSGLDKTVVMKIEQEFTKAQLKKLVRYLNDELAGLRIYDIANRVLVEMRENMSDEQGGDWFDDSSIHTEIEFLSKMAERQRQHLQGLEMALVRIKNKSFGICTVTGELIDKQRLLLVPHTTKSVKAKENEAPAHTNENRNSGSFEDEETEEVPVEE